MNRFTISQLSHLSGISSLTIRTWEVRYHAFVPESAKDRKRYYDGEQLRRLLNIASFRDFGVKVSVLCRLSNASLIQLIEAGISYDEEEFDRLLKRCLDQMGVKNAYLTVLYPLQLRIGPLWRSNTLKIGHEHFIISLLRQKLHAATYQIPGTIRIDDTWLLFLPEAEYYEIGLMVAHYMIRTSGRRSVYLGPDVAFDALLIATPISWLISHQWLQEFAFRITPGWSVWLLTGLLSGLFTLLKVSFHALPTAFVDVVRQLRTE